MLQKGGQAEWWGGSDAMGRRSEGDATVGARDGERFVLPTRPRQPGGSGAKRQRQQRWHGTHMVADIRPCTQLRLRRRAQQPVPMLSPNVLSSSDAANSFPVLMASELLVMPG